MKNYSPNTLINKPGILLIVSILVFLLNIPTYANNISINNIRITGQNTEAGVNNSANFSQIQFDISWENSWRKDLTGANYAAPYNYDAAWIFIKYRIAGGVWQHATLNTTGNSVPAGSVISIASDKKGAFMYRSSNGTGTNNWTGTQLRWYYNLDGVTDDANIEVNVYAIEMVFVPQGSFYVGDGNTDSKQFNTTSTTITPYQITSESVPSTLGGNTVGNMRNSNNVGTGADDFNNTTTKSLLASFPKGFNAFYCMKYELTQQAYVNFLNTLTYTQQVTRTAYLPNKAAGTAALSNSYRNGIQIMTPGVSATTPAVYACNYTDDTNYNNSDDGQNIACNYLEWQDLAAYYDWSGLRPMTELEYEKACRGSLASVDGEYAWGTTNIYAITDVSNPGDNNEISTNVGKNSSYNNNIVGNGPLRVGVFATATATREVAGAGYYGIMELSGNLWETAVTVGIAAGRSFTGKNGDGNLNTSGDANVDFWPGINGNNTATNACTAYSVSTGIGVTESAGIGVRGGAFNNDKALLRTSSRAYAEANDCGTRTYNVSGRGVRVAQ
jgi:formylglycine-generating enzyme required for sulfatase activity